ncbi:hypothetical protein EDF70_10424 [Neorhizobium sp. JUb45]|nr:hypothetical protein EDF70_10424 [Neorhizobium sp. JUb45]
MPHAASIPKIWDCVMTLLIRRLFCRRYRHRESAVKTLARGARHQVSFAGSVKAREDTMKIGCFQFFVKRVPVLIPNV